MRIVQGTANIPQSARGAALAIGNFDGVHRGHQALVKATRDEARKLGVQAGAVVFEPHPREYFQPDKPHFRLTSLPLSLPTAAAAVRQPLWKTLNAMRGRHPLVG